MSKGSRFSTLLGILALAAGCQSTQQMLAETEPTAVDTAVRRGRFDLNCPAATGVMLSDDLIQPAIQGPWVSGIQRREYTVGVEGCGKRTTIVVICQEGTGTCFAANPNREYWNSGYTQ